MVLDLPVICINEVIGEDKVFELIQTHGGCRFYLPKKQFEYQQQMRAYKHAISIGYTHKDALDYVAKSFDRSIRTISNHFVVGLFDDNK